MRNIFRWFAFPLIASSKWTFMNHVFVCSKFSSDLVLQLKLLRILQCLWRNIIFKTGFHICLKRREGYQWLSGDSRMQMKEGGRGGDMKEDFIFSLFSMSPAWLVWFFLLCSRLQVFPIKTSELTLMASCRAVGTEYLLRTANNYLFWLCF